MNVGGYTWIAEGAHKNGVEIAGQHLEGVGRDGGAVAEVAVGAPVEAGELDGRAAGANDFESVRNDFLADTVSGNDGDALWWSREKDSRKKEAVSTQQSAVSENPARLGGKCSKCAARKN